MHNVPETFFGTTMDDPYRDFEDIKAPAVATWMEVHSDPAHATLQSVTGRAEMRDKLERLSSAAAALVVEVQRLPGGLYFYERRGPKEGQFKLYLRRGLQGTEKLLFDPEALKKKAASRTVLRASDPGEVETCAYHSTLARLRSGKPGWQKSSWNATPVIYLALDRFSGKGPVTAPEGAQAAPPERAHAATAKLH